MADAVVQLPADGAGKKLDAESLTVGLNTVYRERIQVAGDSDTDIAPVTAADGLLVNLGTNNDVSLNAGTNNIGDVDVLSIAAGDNNIGNVDVVTLPALPAGTNNIGDVDVATVPAPLSTTGGGTEATALRVTVASDSTGVVSVDDNGSSLTVDGTVAVTGVSTEAKQDTQITHLATIAGDTTDIEAAVELLDDTVATLGTTTYTEAASKGLVIGAVRRDADTTLVDTTNEVAPLQVDANGRLKVEAFSGETLPVSGTVTANLAAGTNNIGDVDILSIAAGDNNIGNVDIASIAAGDNNIGNVDIVSVPAPLSTTGGGTEATALRVTVASDSTGVLSVDDNGSSLTVDGTVATTFAIPTTGLTIFRSIDLDESEEEVKATAGAVYGMWFSNLATSTRFLKFYNATAANVTVGTTTPVLTIALPGNASDDISGVFGSTHGIAFGTAITVAATTGVADNDTGAPGANEVLLNLFYV